MEIQSGLKWMLKIIKDYIFRFYWDAFRDGKVTTKRVLKLLKSLLDILLPI